MIDLNAPLGTAGSLLLDELMSIEWRHRPEPRRAAPLLVAGLPTGRLELSCNQAVDEVVATLDGVPVGRVHDKALVPQDLMWDGAPGPRIELGERSGTLTWRMRGSKLRPLGRTRWMQLELDDGAAYSYFAHGLFHPLVRSATPDGERVVTVGVDNLDPGDTEKVKVADLDTSRHTLTWLAQATTAELVLAELMTMGMATRSLWSLPGKLLHNTLKGSAGD